MESLYHQTNRKLQEVQQGLGRLEISTGNQTHLIENDLFAQLEEINSNSERLEVLVNKEPAYKRQSSKLRLDQLRQESKHIYALLVNFNNRRIMKERQRQEREVLLTTTFKTNDEEATAIDIDADLNHHSSLQSAHRNIDDIISHGSSIMDSLRNQRGTLKGVKTRMLNMANTLGLSNTVMRLIERRTTEDKLILFGGMIITSVIMFILWRYYA